jgi:hypothetical protein
MVLSDMSNDTLQIERDGKTGRFLPGNAGNGGRKPGQRNKLGERFIQDLSTVWAEQGIDALRRCAVEEPAQFCRVVASLLPKDLNVSGNVDIGIDAGNVLQNFRHAVELLGNQPPRLPNVKVINGKS